MKATIPSLSLGSHREQSSAQELSYPRITTGYIEAIEVVSTSQLPLQHSGIVTGIPYRIVGVPCARPDVLLHLVAVGRIYASLDEHGDVALRSVLLLLLECGSEELVGLVGLRWVSISDQALVEVEGAVPGDFLPLQWHTGRLSPQEG